MPWGKALYEKILSVQEDFFDDILKYRGQRELAFKEMIIRAEILKYDFTKRQLKILSFILVLSYVSGKEYAIIPKLQDFEIAGISKFKIKNEIRIMEDMGVIIWNKDLNEFSINDPKKWNVSYNAGHNYNRFVDIFDLNLKHIGHDVKIVFDTKREEGY